MATIGTILISPHSDDLALSIGGALLKRVLPQPCTAITVFTRSDYAPSELGTPSSEEITQKRKEEDNAYLSSLGIDLANLDFPGADLRGYGPFTSTKSILKEWRSDDDPIYRSVAEKLHQIVAASSPAYLVIPLGLGCHVDHLIVCDACLAANAELTRIYYEDLPYAAKYPLARISKIALSVDETAGPFYVDLGEGIQQKIDNLRFYGSQLSIHYQSSVFDYATRLGKGKGPFERLWVSQKGLEPSVEERHAILHVSRRLHMMDVPHRIASQALGRWW
jgi:LmbE family N-acetylglucosaminyl deacetylase